ncbi:MAG: DUF1638 domain-containing protein [Alphaproteobacteria bacterium]|nr:DUF1638 domain-containing protein [Alphaproteobacteria bacterium]
MPERPRTILIACGALAREIIALIQANGWTDYAVTCLPADLHNRPERIASAVRDKIRAVRPDYDRIMVLYADCGTGGHLDAVLEEEGVERIAGTHCYGFYSGLSEFDAMMDEEPGTFFLTDYLARHFDTLIIKGLGIDRYPQLLEEYFGNYRRLVYLAQVEDATLAAKAQQAAERLGLCYEYRFTGMGGLAAFLEPRNENGEVDDRLLA